MSGLHWTVALVGAAQLGLAAQERELEGFLESMCLLREKDGALVPDRETMNPDFEDDVAEMEANIAASKAAIALAVSVINEGAPS